MNKTLGNQKPHKPPGILIRIARLPLQLYGAWFYVVFVLFFLLFFPIFRILLYREKWFPAVNWLRRIWARLTFIFMFYRWEVRFEQPLDPSKNYVICSNHSSNLDIPLSALCLKGRYGFVSKKQWGDLPLFGVFFGTIDLVMDREHPKNAYLAYKQAARELRKGVTLIVYPEGSMSATGPVTRPFKNGAFRMAVETQTDIVPVTFLDNWRLYPTYGMRGARPGKLRAIVHTPISTAGMNENDIQQLRTKVRSVIENCLSVAYKSNNPASPLNTNP